MPAKPGAPAAPKPPCFAGLEAGGDLSRHAAQAVDDDDPGGGRNQDGRAILTMEFDRQRNFSTRACCGSTQATTRRLALRS